MTLTLYEKECVGVFGTGVKKDMAMQHLLSSVHGKYTWVHILTSKHSIYESMVPLDCISTNGIVDDIEWLIEHQKIEPEPILVVIDLQDSFWFKDASLMQLITQRHLLEVTIVFVFKTWYHIIPEFRQHLDKMIYLMQPKRPLTFSKTIPEYYTTLDKPPEIDPETFLAMESTN